VIFCNWLDSLFSSLSNIGGRFGFHAFLLTGVPLPNETLKENTLLSGWPDEWYELYNSKGYVHLDPVANRIRETTITFMWSDVAYDKSREKRGHIVMKESTEFRLNDGFCVPIYTAKGALAVATFGGEKVDLSGRDKSALQLVSMFAHSKAVELARTDGGDDEKDDFPRLTPREMECLEWASMGKTAWEIGVILGISKNTVNEYFCAINRKLNTTSKIHSVAQALRSGVLH